MSLDERIVSAVDAGNASTTAALAKFLTAPEQVVKMRAGLLVKRGRLVREGDEFSLADPVPSAPVARVPTSKRAKEPEHEILLAADEDGDLQLQRRDGEGEVLCIPGNELARLVAFVKRHFKDALRG